MIEAKAFINQQEILSMIQKREDSRDDDIILSMRYGLKSEQIATQITSALMKKNISYEIYPSSKSKYNEIVIIIENLDSIDIDPFYIKALNDELGLDEQSFDFFFGITSGFQLGGFTLPAHVVNYLRVIGGVVHFSYSIYFNEDE